MKPEFEDILHLKNKLWKMRLELCSEVKTRKWTENNLNTALKKLKNNKTRDPLGLVNEIMAVKVKLLSQPLCAWPISILYGSENHQNKMISGIF